MIKMKYRIDSGRLINSYYVLWSPTPDSKFKYLCGCEQGVFIKILVLPWCSFQKKKHVQSGIRTRAWLAGACVLLDIGCLLAWLLAKLASAAAHWWPCLELASHD
jgi:hypothetical protein